MTCRLNMQFSNVFESDLHIPTDNCYPMFVSWRVFNASPSSHTYRQGFKNQLLRNVSLKKHRGRRCVAKNHVGSSEPHDVCCLGYMKSRFIKSIKKNVLEVKPKHMHTTCFLWHPVVRCVRLSEIRFKFKEVRYMGIQQGFSRYLSKLFVESASYLAASATRYLQQQLHGMNFLTISWDIRKDFEPLGNETTGWFELFFLNGQDATYMTRHI